MLPRSRVGRCTESGVVGEKRKTKRKEKYKWEKGWTCYAAESMQIH